MAKKKADVQAPLPDASALVPQQQQANTAALKQNLQANRINQVTPFGNVTFSGDPLTGQTQTTTLTPGAQGTLSNQENLAQLLSGLGIDAASGINLGQPDLSGLPDRVSSLDPSGLPQLFGAGDLEDTRKRLEQSQFDRQIALLDPQFQQQTRRTEQTLADRGFDLEQSQGARTALGDLSTQQNLSRERAASDAVRFAGDELSRLSSTALANRGQGLTELLANAGLANEGRSAGLNEALTLRNLPFNDLSALNTLTPDLPTLAPPAPFTAGTQPTDVAGINLAAYQAALNKAQLDQKAKQGFFSNLTSLATAPFQAVNF